MEAIEATGCALLLQQLESPWLPVAMVSVQHAEVHFTTLGLAAADTFEQAAAGALDEAEARVYAWLHGHKGSISKPEDVSTPEHHFELYGLKRYFRSADRVLFPETATQVSGWPEAPRVPLSMEGLVGRLAAEGHAPVAIDITPEAHSIDQGRTPLSVMKVIVPGLVPISFGYEKEPLGMVARVHADARFPHPFP
jgi:ribosomal protein S12 methylthiotransferase accessory factor